MLRYEADENAYRKTYKAGELIFREGEHANHAYIIERGTVGITFERNGEEVKLAELGPGEIFGEMSLIDNDVRSATATARSETEVVVIRRQQIQTALEHSDTTVRMLMAVLLGRFRSLKDKITYPPNSNEAAMLERQLRAEHQRAIDRLKFEQELQQTISAQEFRLEFQPIIDLNDGKVAGFEALIRWDHPELGTVSPVQLFELARTKEMLLEIDCWVVENAITELRALWEKHGGNLDSLPFISVNLSAASMADGVSLRKLKEVLAAQNVAPEAVQIEITEGALAESPVTANSIMHELHRLGVRIGIDDFGTGYSSIGNLVRFPIVTLKLDPMLVNDMIEDEVNRGVVEAVVQMAHALKMNICAVGVEEVGELQALSKLGCQYVQGFLLSRPVSPEDAVKFALGGGVVTPGPVLLRGPN